MDVAIGHRAGQICVDRYTARWVHAVGQSSRAVLNRDVVVVGVDTLIKVGVELHHQTVRDASGSRCATGDTIVAKSDAATVRAQCIRSWRRGILNHEGNAVRRPVASIGAA